jgi:hypothetical protein
MKLMKLLTVMGGLVITFGFGGAALAFHDGGVAECAGCHAMHNYDPATGTVGSPSDFNLLIASTPSDTCLECHSTAGQKTVDGTGYGSGGDYYWITKSWVWTAHGSEHRSDGYNHGHSISAPDHGLDQAGETNQESPGGNYPLADLGCNSCHDPHGKLGNELLLYGNELTYKDYQFVNPAPILLSAGRTTTGTRANTDIRHTAFGSGVSPWCANCHADFFTQSANNMHRTSVALRQEHVTNYNAYVMNVVETADIKASGYAELVPFETGAVAGEEDTLDNTSVEGPNGQSMVMCLTCHRSHATAFLNNTRWDMTETFLFESHPGGAAANDLSTDADRTNSYYGREWPDTGNDSSQRSLCNKCHGQDFQPAP